VRLASRRAGEAVHLVFVAGLVAVVVLHALTNRASLSGALPLVVAGALGVLGRSSTCARQRSARS